jgi:hypothetical protein
MRRELGGLPLLEKGRVGVGIRSARIVVKILDPHPARWGPAKPTVVCLFALH